MAFVEITYRTLLSPFTLLSLSIDIATKMQFINEPVILYEFVVPYSPVLSSVHYVL